jgi:TatD DNase family protein
MIARTSLCQILRRSISVSPYLCRHLRQLSEKAPGLQLSLAKKYHLPLFLHSRAAHVDFVNILREEGFGDDGGRKNGANGGVVHSFTGTKSEVEELVSLSTFICL